MDQKTINTYNKKAKEYKSETDDFWKRFPSEFINVFKSELRGKKVLDIGSGPGRDAEILRKSGLEVTCVDASTSMVTMTRDMGFESVESGFSEIPFSSESFDGVWSYTSLLHIPKVEAIPALKEIYRIMKVDSVFGLGLIEGDGEEEKYSMGEDYPRHFSYFRREEVEALTMECGMEKVYFERHPVKSKNYLHFVFRKPSNSLAKKRLF